MNLNIPNPLLENRALNARLQVTLAARGLV
jgi:hypothetical protein